MLKQWVTRCVLAVLMAAACAAQAAGIKVENAWAVATVPGQTVGGAYMTITSPVAATLVGAQSEAAGKTQIHKMAMVQGVMEMRRIRSLALPEGLSVVLKPGSYHIMLMDLKAPLKVGGRVPIVLTVRVGHRSERIKVSARVRPRSALVGMMH
ncbi:MAG: copper chaperone PCu(A)C [Betaproteobacteria bacterium]|nr:copper chaperone PCu(A)C [Betaproteobacteria bacterium]